MTDSTMPPAEPEAVKPQNTADQILPLRTWQERLLNGMLYAASGLGLPAFIIGSIAALRNGQPTQIIIFGVAYVFVLIITFIRRWIPYQVRAAGLLVITLGLGLDALRSTGLGGSGGILLVAFAVMATILFGLRGGWIAFGVSVAATLGAAWAITAGVLTSPYTTAPTDLGSWIIGGLVFALLTVILVIALGTLHRGLEASLSHENELVQTLLDQQTQLESRVGERTGDLQRQSLQLQTAAEIARLSAETTDLQTLLNEAIELIRARFGFYHASIFLMDDTRAWAELSASTGTAGRAMLDRRHKLAVGSASIIGWVTANRMPRVSPNVADDPFYFRNPTLPDTQSEMAVPLMIGPKLIGALDVQSTEPDAFGDVDIRVVEAIAGDLAFAIDHARLTEEREAQLSELETGLREQIRQSWTQYARAESPTIIHVGAQADNEGGEIAFEGLTEKAAEGRTVVSEEGLEVVVPVKVRGETIAAIAARRPAAEGAWKPDDIALIEAVAGQAALAMETARQYAEEQRRVAELEVVNRVSQAASQLVRVDSLLRMVGRQVLQVMDEADVVVALYDEDQRQITFPYATQDGEPADLSPATFGQGLESQVIRTQQPLLISEDVGRQAAEMGIDLQGRAFKSFLGVPLLVGDRVIGVLAVQDMNRERRFSEDDVALLATVAGQVATALQNARLLEQVQQSARRERLIHEITSKVRQSPDIQTVLETTAREVGRALNAARATIRLGEGPGEHLSPEAQPSDEAVEDG